MARDSIVEAVRNDRRRTEKACGGDWERLIEHYRSVQRKVASKRIVSGHPKRVASVGASKD